MALNTRITFFFFNLWNAKRLVSSGVTDWKTREGTGHMRRGRWTNVSFKKTHVSQCNQLPSLRKGIFSTTFPIPTSFFFFRNLCSLLRFSFPVEWEKKIKTDCKGEKSTALNNIIAFFFFLPVLLWKMNLWSFPTVFLFTRFFFSLINKSGFAGQISFSFFFCYSWQALFLDKQTNKLFESSFFTLKES